MAAAVALAESGTDVLIGYTGGNIHGGKTKELVSALSLPAALPCTGKSAWQLPLRLPSVPDDRGILILAMPRSETDNALDYFLRELAANQAGRESTLRVSRKVDLIFFCGGFTDDSAGSKADENNPIYNKRLAAAAACAAMYSRRPGVSARAAGV